jgi:hypothetical protein
MKQWSSRLHCLLQSFPRIVFAESSSIRRLEIFFEDEAFESEAKQSAISEMFCTNLQVVPTKDWCKDPDPPLHPTLLPNLWQTGAHDDSTCSVENKGPIKSKESLCSEVEREKGSEVATLVVKTSKPVPEENAQDEKTGEHIVIDDNEVHNSEQNDEIVEIRKDEGFDELEQALAKLYDRERTIERLQNELKNLKNQNSFKNETIEGLQNELKNSTKHHSSSKNEGGLVCESLDITQTAGGGTNKNHDVSMSVQRSVTAQTIGTQTDDLAIFVPGKANGHRSAYQSDLPLAKELNSHGCLLQPMPNAEDGLQSKNRAAHSRNDDSDDSDDDEVDDSYKEKNRHDHDMKSKRRESTMQRLSIVAAVDSPSNGNSGRPTSGSTPLRRASLVLSNEMKHEMRKASALAMAVPEARQVLLVGKHK